MTANPVPDDGSRRAARNLLLESELVRIAGALSAEGVDTVVLKGVPLTRRLFGRLDARPMIDNDLLVHRTDVFRARQVVRGLGYEDLPYRRLESQLGVDFQYLLVRPISASLRLPVELHWNAVPPRLFPVPEALLWAHTEPYPLKDLTVRVFDRPLTMLHLAAHFAQHHFGEPRILRDLVRAWNLWGAEVARVELGRLGRETGLLPHLDYALGSASALGLLEVPYQPFGSCRAALVRRLLPATRLHDRRPRFDYIRMALGLLLADPRRIPFWLLPQVFPPIDTMAAIHDRPVTPALYLRYLVRPLRPLRRILRRARRSARASHDSWQAEGAGEAAAASSSARPGARGPAAVARGRRRIPPT